MRKAGKPRAKAKPTTAMKASNRLATAEYSAVAAASSATGSSASSASQICDRRGNQLTDSTARSSAALDWNAIKLAAESRLDRLPDEGAIEVLVNSKFSALLPTINLADIHVDLNAIRDELRASAVAELSECSEIQNKFDVARAAVEALAIAVAADPTLRPGDSKKAEIDPRIDPRIDLVVSPEAVGLAVTENLVAKEEQMVPVAAQDEKPAPATDSAALAYDVTASEVAAEAEAAAEATRAVQATAATEVNAADGAPSAGAAALVPSSSSTSWFEWRAQLTGDHDEAEGSYESMPTKSDDSSSTSWFEWRAQHTSGHVEAEGSYEPMATKSNDAPFDPSEPRHAPASSDATGSSR